MSLFATCLVGLFFVVFGASRVWIGGVVLPHEYRTLARAGLPVTLTVARCATGMHGDRSFECEVTTASGGRPRTWTYPNDVRQFWPYAPGTQVAALSDPASPSTVYTVRDVQGAAGAGWSSPGAVFGFVSTSVGFVVGVTGWVVFGRGRSRSRRGTLNATWP